MSEIIKSIKDSEKIGVRPFWDLGRNPLEVGHSPLKIKLKVAKKAWADNDDFF